MFDGYLVPGAPFGCRANRSEYDTKVLKERANQWRDVAATVTFESIRVFCLKEADKCERRLQLSFSTPVFVG
jgi:hypothetical protein